MLLQTLASRPNLAELHPSKFKVDAQRRSDLLKMMFKDLVEVAVAVLRKLRDVGCIIALVLVPGLEGMMELRKSLVGCNPYPNVIPDAFGFGRRPISSCSFAL